MKKSERRFGTSVNPHRHRWTDIPTELRSKLEETVGGPALSWETQPGGFTGGVASVVTFEGGARLFVKGVPASHGLVKVFRQEANVNAHLPEGVPSPRMLMAVDAHDWFVMAFEALDGSIPDLDDPGHFQTLLACIEGLGKACAKTTLDLPTVTRLLGGYVWRDHELMGCEISDGILTDWASANLARLAELEAQQDELCAGAALLHCDLRADNFLIGDGQGWVVDWSWPCKGPAWMDLLIFLATSGRSADSCESIFRASWSGSRAGAVEIDAGLALLAGVWASRASLPDLPHAPELRRSQRRAAVSALRWLEWRST